MSSYEKEYLWAKNEPESFWRAQARISIGLNLLKLS